MVYRIFVEKKPGFDLEAKGMLADLKSNLGIAGLKDVRMFNRYDAENMSKEQFDYAVKYVFSEPQMDCICDVSMRPSRSRLSLTCCCLYRNWAS